MYNVIEEGFSYQIVDTRGNIVGDINLVHRKDGNIVPGMTLEDLYKVLLHSLAAKQKKKWGAENEIQIQHLEACLQSQKVNVTRLVNEKKLSRSEIS